MSKPCIIRAYWGYVEIATEFDKDGNPTGGVIMPGKYVPKFLTAYYKEHPIPPPEDEEDEPPPSVPSV